MTNRAALRLPFMKMHGLGNDFVVIDDRGADRAVTDDVVVAMADRHRGIGFDQLAVLTPTEDADIRLTFYNADGSIAGACGNATRCVARYMMDETATDVLTLRTERGLLAAHRVSDALTAVNLGQPILEWDKIPLSQSVNLDALPLDGAPLATGMGNPHCTFFVDNAEAVDLATRGPQIEHHPLFPERTNVQFAHVIGPDHLRMRVWERGTGITLASGSSSCATAVAAHRAGLTGRSVTIELDGGTIQIEWRDDGVWMTGPTAHVFSGVWHG